MLHSCPDDFPSHVIHGDRFAAIADVEINRPAGGARIERGLERLGRGARIAFVKTDLLSRAWALLRGLADPEPFVLITHNSDYAITRELFESAPKCVARWYALNVDHEAADLIPLPSGMERPHGGGYSADYVKVQQAWAAAPKRVHAAFACWNADSNASERSRIRSLLEGQDHIVWHERGLSHLDFLRMCGESHFVISPPGNGIDCHRTWEAMYMGAIPIVRRSPHTSAFTDLPMVLVNDWAGVTSEVLSRTRAQYDGISWNHEKLFFPYWEKRIRDDARRL